MWCPWGTPRRGRASSASKSFSQTMTRRKKSAKTRAASMPAKPPPITRALSLIIRGLRAVLFIFRGRPTACRHPTGRSAISLCGLEVHKLRNLGRPQSLHLNRSGELGWRTDAQRLADAFETALELWVKSYRADVGSYPVAKLDGHIAPAKEAREAVDRHDRLPRFLRRRDIGEVRRTLAIRDGQEARLAGFKHGERADQPRNHYVDATFTQVRKLRCSFLVRHMEHGERLVL